jgi:alcohol dehydrogenase class IV
MRCDPSSGGNPVPLTAKDYEALYRKAISGEL